MRIVFLLFVFQVYIVQAFTTNYYFSPTGNNASAGTSPGEAWLDFDQLESVTIQAGDSILLEAGQVFATTKKISLWRWVDNVDGTYGNGDDITYGNVPLSDAENPIIITTYPANGAAANIRFMTDDNCIDIYNVQGIEICNISMTGIGMTNYPSKAGVSVFNDEAYGAPLTDTLKGYSIHDLVVGGFKNGIIAGCWDRATENISIKNCTAHSNLTGGISTYAAQTGDINDIVIKNCIAHNNAGDPGNDSTNTGSGIVIGDADNATVEHCIAYNNGYQCSAPEGPVGIWTYASANVTIQYCEAYENKTDGPADGGGFDIDGGCQNCTIQYCYSHDNDGAGYLICQYSGAGTYNNNVVRYNISQDDGAKNGYGAINFWSSGASGGIQHTEIYGNTIYNSVAPAVRFINTSGISGTMLRNNIFVIDNGQFLVKGNPSTSVAKFEGNAYWSGSSSFLVGNETSLTDWRNNRGQEMISGNPSGYRMNPKLKNPGGGQTINNTDYLDTLSAYKLTVTSPFLDKGLDLSSYGIDPGTHDYFNNAIPYKDELDIGAHEYSGIWPSIDIPDTVYIGWHNGDDTTFSVLSNISWDIQENISWFDPDIASGTGDDILTITATESNPDTIERTGKIIAAKRDSSVAPPDTAIVMQMPAPTFNVTFTVDDGTNVVENAEIGFSGKTLYTNASGQVTFSHVTIGNDKSYSISKAGFNNKSGSINIVKADTSLTVSLTPVAAGTYQVTFFVDDGTDFIQNAEVSFDTNKVFTNSSGEAIFNGVEPGTDRPYIIVASGYDTIDSTLTIVDTDITEYVTMDMQQPTLYTVSFIIINDNNDSIQNASITFNGYGSQNTDATGKTVFTDVAAEDTVAYTVTASNYHDTSGNVTVTGNTTITITMNLLTGNHKCPVNTIKAYPNPAKGHVNITAGKPMAMTEIYNLNGTKINTLQTQSNMVNVDLGNISDGIYIIKIIFADETSERIKIIVK